MKLNVVWFSDLLDWNIFLETNPTTSNEFLEGLKKYRKMKERETNPSFDFIVSLLYSNTSRNRLNFIRQGCCRGGIRRFRLKCDYIIPPSFIAGAAGVGSGISTMPHSVVRNIPATEAAFSRATRLTLVGSMTPASNIFIYSPVRAL